MIGGTSGSGRELSSPSADGISNLRNSNHSDHFPASSRDSLQEWLEGFAERLKGRTNAVADEVQQVVDEMGAVELNLQNTFNGFRCLSSSQFVENRVYDEDETEVISVVTPRKDAKQPSMPTESYEDEILPRYKDAVAIAWAAFQGRSCQREQSSMQPKSHGKLRDSHKDEGLQLLPHIIGTEDFMRDVHCGLADLRQRQHVTDDSGFYANVERDRVDLAAELIGTGTPSEGEVSGTDTDASDYEEGGLEPAVSAALDFKAMLEAALRNPSLPYDQGTLSDSHNVFGEFNDNKFSLPNLSNDTLSNSPRTISSMVDIIGKTMSTMGESKDELRNNTFEVSDAIVSNVQLPPGDHEALEVSVQSTSEENAMPFRSLQPDGGDTTDKPALEQVPKRPFNSQTQAMLNQEFRQFLDNNGGSRPVIARGLGHAASNPRLLLDDGESEAGVMVKEYAVLPNSNTGPTVPEGLFQKQPSSDGTGHARTESQSSNSWDDSQVVLNSQPSLVNTVMGTSNKDSNQVFKDLERKGSDKPQLSTSSAVPQPASSSISSGSNVTTSSHQSGPLPIRGGLFDDDDDDEDPGDLFGATASRAESQPSLRPWASRSSKGLFDDINDVDSEQDGTTWIPDEAQSSDEAQPNNIISSFVTPQYENQSKHGSLDSHRKPFVSVTSSVGTTQLDIIMPSDSKEINSDRPFNGVEENIRPPILSILASAVRSSVPLSVDSDEDSWSGSESKDNSVAQGEADTEQYISQVSALEVLEANDSGTSAAQGGTAEGNFDLKRADSVGSDYLAQSLSSTEKTSPGAIHTEERQNSVSSSATAHEVLPAGSPPAMSRFFQAAEPSPLTVAVKLGASPLLQSPILKLSDGDESDPDSDSSQSQRISQRQPVQSIFTDTLDPSEKLASSSSQPTSLVGESNLHSRNVSKTSIRDLPVPVNQFTTRRMFAPLFEDDDIEEDLFGQGSSNYLFPRTEHDEMESSSDATSDVGLHGQSPLMTQGTTPQLLQISSSSADLSIVSPPIRVESKDEDLSSNKPSSKLSSLPFEEDESKDGDLSSIKPSSKLSSLPFEEDESKDGDLSSIKPSSKLSSLLFGEDDEDDENALFGPLGGRTFQGNSGTKSEKGFLLFGNATLPSSFSRSPTKGHSLFDN